MILLIVFQQTYFNDCFCHRHGREEMSYVFGLSDAIIHLIRNSGVIIANRPRAPNLWIVYNLVVAADGGRGQI
jgi:hypothetical protein